MGLLEGGTSIQDVANIIGVHFKTIENWQFKWEQENRLENNPKSGRPRVSIEEEDEELVEYIKENHFKNAVQAKGNVQFPGCVQTARNRMREQGLRSYVASKKPDISDRNRQTRVEYATEARELPAENFDDWDFSDEKAI
jgi:transposase-like protein